MAIKISALEKYGWLYASRPISLVTVSTYSIYTLVYETW